MASNERGFIIVTKDNLSEIAEMANNRGGRILMANSEPNYGDKIVGVHIMLFSHMTISDKGVLAPYLCALRGSRMINGVEWQTNWQDDRDYTLRPVRKDSNNPLVNTCQNLFEKLTLGNYEFSIEFQPVVGTSLLSQRNLVLYVPRKKRMKPAFSFVLRQMIGRMPQERQGQLIRVFRKIANYAMRDLGNQEILRHNVEAGKEADYIMM